ncbi:hypothetical protein WK27_26175 [Burkholderia vietnamiensis]|nr:hypothetical protein WK27_26175 [Burkholderia vietnamiensis]
MIEPAKRHDDQAITYGKSREVEGLRIAGYIRYARIRSPRNLIRLIEHGHIFTGTDAVIGRFGAWMRK